MRVLVVSVHPDDETLGCGGSLLRHRQEGDGIFWLIVSAAHEPHWSAEIIARKAEEVDRVASAYRVEKYFRLKFPAGDLDRTPQRELIGAIGQVIAEVRPEILYLVHDGDVHTDHHAVFTATQSVVKAFCMRKLGVRRILCYETLSSTEAALPQFSRVFVPNVYSDISAYIDRKIEIMSLYESEAQPEPLPRTASAIRALARYRGAAIGVGYAEAYMLVREVA